jgi:SAM-dependent MidA family methyltransferase
MTVKLLKRLVIALMWFIMIDEPTGLLRFDRFMELALYGPAGFYQSGNGAGTQRDFLTSPEVGTLFGAVLARRIDAEWDRLNQPQLFTIVEVGAGPATLARTIFAARPRCSDALQYVLVDRAEGMRALHQEHLPNRQVKSMAQLPSDPIVGMVIAHELLDNIPTRVLDYSSDHQHWRDVAVSHDSFGNLHETYLDGPAIVPSEFGELIKLIPSSGSVQRIPFQEQAQREVICMHRLLSAGSLLLIDYARKSTAKFAELAQSDWMRTYRSHERGTNPLQNPGLCDITVDVALDQVTAAIGEPTVVRSQAEALDAWGLADVLAESNKVWSDRESDYDLGALRARSHATEAPILTDPAGLGGFTVLEWLK